MCLFNLYIFSSTEYILKDDLNTFTDMAPRFLFFWYNHVIVVFYKLRRDKHSVTLDETLDVAWEIYAVTWKEIKLNKTFT